LNYGPTVLDLSPRAARRRFGFYQRPQQAC